MKIFLYIIAGFTFVGPIAGWAYLIALASGFSTNSSNNGFRWGGYLDMDFVALAAAPWLICLVSLFFALRMQ